MTKDTHLIFEAYRKSLVGEETASEPAPEVTAPASADIGPDVGPLKLSGIEFPDENKGYEYEKIYTKNQHADIQDPVAKSVFEKLPEKIPGQLMRSKINQIMNDPANIIDRKKFMGIVSAFIDGKAFFSKPEEKKQGEVDLQPLDVTQKDVEDTVRELPGFRAHLRQKAAEVE